MLNGWALDVVVYEVYIGQGAREYVDVVELFQVLASANHMAYTFARNMFWNHDRHFTNCRMLIKLWTSNPCWRTKVLNVKVWIPT